jgi:hypothetical protein
MTDRLRFYVFLGPNYTAVLCLLFKHNTSAGQVYFPLGDRVHGTDVALFTASPDYYLSAVSQAVANTYIIKKAKGSTYQSSKGKLSQIGQPRN